MYLLYKVFYKGEDGEFIAYLGRTKQRINARLRGHFKQLPMHKQEDDNRVMLAMYEAEQFHPYARYIDDFKGFKADWEAGTYDPGCTFTFPLAAVEVIEVVQEEQDNTDHEKVKRTVAAAKEEVFLQRRKARAMKKHRKKKRR